VTTLGPGYSQLGQYTGAGGTWVPPIIKEAITSASSAPPLQAGSGYRFLTTNILTGALLGDWLPITGQSFARQLSTAATGTCELSLVPDRQANLANLAAVQPRKSVLWVLQEGAVIWSGIIWDWQHTTVLDGTLPLSCSTMESFLGVRVINTTLIYTAMDVFDMARGLVGYALGKSPGGLIANLTFSGAESGITDTLTFDGSQRQTVADAMDTLVTTYEVEYSFRPYQDAGGNFMTSFDLAFPYLGEAFPASKLVYQMPGNVQDYGFTAMGSSSANRVLATATSSDASGNTLTGRATDMADIGAGYPLAEMAVSCSEIGWTTNAQVANFAAGYLPQVTDTQLTPLLTLPGGVYPTLAETVLGSFAQVSLTSSLHPAQDDGAPGYSGVGRVTGWVLTPPSGDGTPETTQIQIGNLTLTGEPVTPPVPDS
jgi:hypothetical protein